jgi:hypothetical protein
MLKTFLSKTECPTHFPQKENTKSSLLANVSFAVENHGVVLPKRMKKTAYQDQENRRSWKD